MLVLTYSHISNRANFNALRHIKFLNTHKTTTKRLTNNRRGNIIDTNLIFAEGCLNFLG